MAIIFLVTSPLWFFGFFLFPQPVGLLFGLAFLAFVAVAAICFKLYKNEKEKRNYILENGAVMEGTVEDYLPGHGVLLNEQPPVDLLVNAENKGEWKQFVVPTNQYDRFRYPVGSTVYFSLVESGDTVLIEKPEDLKQE